jgi:threonine/homoserine/homoserine lactone efflux protein
VLNVIVSSVAAGFGLGVALASAPGPVQAVLLTESVRGGIGRGFQAQLGANVTFAALLVSLALGLSLAAPGGTALRVLKLVGGAFLLVIAADVFRSRYEVGEAGLGQRALSPAARGTLAVVLNPGVWLFLGTAASSLLSTAVHTGGTASAISAAVALSIGLALGDGAVVLFGGIGLRRAGDWVVIWLPRALGAVLAGLGIWLVVGGITS